MIPRVASQGKSFKGAGLYYLHDKEAMTSERVGYTETLNLPTDDPEKAMKCMAWVASHQRDIKEANAAREGDKDGMSYEEYVREKNPFRGRAMQNTVYAYSLSWHPSEQITPQEMAHAAKETLIELGLRDHQSVLVQHTDETHPHMHVIVNKVNPDTGYGPKRLNEKTGRMEDALKNDHIKLSLWAEGYERRTGRILCWNRVENNAKRFPTDGSEPQFVKYKGEHASRPDYDWWQNHKDKNPDDIRASRLEKQAAERNTLQHKEERARKAFEVKIERDYADIKQKLEKQILSAQARLKADNTRPRLQDGIIDYTKAFMRSAGRKLTGASAKDMRLLSELQGAHSAVNEAQNLRRERFETRIASSWQKLKNKQSAERQRDEKRIQLLAKERETQRHQQNAKIIRKVETKTIKPKKKLARKTDPQVKRTEPSKLLRKQPETKPSPAKPRRRNRNRNRNRNR